MKLARSNSIGVEHSVWSEEAISMKKNIPIDRVERWKNIPLDCDKNR